MALLMMTMLLMVMKHDHHTVEFASNDDEDEDRMPHVTNHRFLVTCILAFQFHHHRSRLRPRDHCHFLSRCMDWRASILHKPAPSLALGFGGCRPFTEAKCLGSSTICSSVKCNNPISALSLEPLQHRKDGVCSAGTSSRGVCMLVS